MNFASFSNLQRNQFWIFQLIGWSALFVILILLSILFNPPTAGYFVSLALTYAGSALIAAILTLGLRLIYRWTWESGFIVRFLLAWFGSLFTAYLWQLAQIDLANMLLDAATIEGRVLFGEFLIFSYPLMLFWSGFYFIFDADFLQTHISVDKKTYTSINKRIDIYYFNIFILLCNI